MNHFSLRSYQHPSPAIADASRVGLGNALSVCRCVLAWVQAERSIEIGA